MYGRFGKRVSNPALADTERVDGEDIGYFIKLMVAGSSPAVFPERGARSSGGRAVATKRTVIDVSSTLFPR